jgi:hypothetical protein
VGRTDSLLFYDEHEETRLLRSDPRPDGSVRGLQDHRSTAEPLVTGTSSASPSPEIPPAGGSVSAEKWLGKWNGPEGTFLLLSRNGNRYLVKIQSLDGLDGYEGVATADGIRFPRNGKTESIHAGNGEDTGMKWLLDKKNCLIIKYGEGFCRD